MEQRAIQNVLPWGRSFSEYERMFSLSTEDLSKIILGCGDGPASFNGEMTRQGHNVVSIDPIYQFTKEQIANRIDEALPLIIENTKEYLDRYNWAPPISNLDDLVRVRMAAMNQFLGDFDTGVKENRYRCEMLPNLPFDDQEFELALCSHFLFTYSVQLDLNTHLEHIREMCRVANEVRIFPIVDMDGNPSPHIEPVITALGADGCVVTRRKVDYDYQIGGNEMLVIVNEEN
jgi:hypothetical protein